jgi:hypothetical protein
MQAGLTKALRINRLRIRPNRSIELPQLKSLRAIVHWARLIEPERGRGQSLLQWDAAPLDSDAPLALNPGEHEEEWCAWAVSVHGHRNDVHERHVRLQEADPNALWC